MNKINFTKMVASGNDFVVLDVTKSQSHKVTNWGWLSKKICDRKFGIGADGLLVLEKSRKADIRMRIFNADGSEAEMCGNGARCAALYTKSQSHKATKSQVTIETRAGIIEAEVNGESVKIKLTDPKDFRINIPISIGNRRIKVNFVNTGVPHTVIFVEGLDKINVSNLGRQVRDHKQFAPAGTNVNFVQVLDNDSIKVRTYERGVEDETLACGTGSAASALVTAYLLLLTNKKVNVYTQGGEVLKVYFNVKGNNFKNVWLEGKARIVYMGVYYV